jgi:hypothetical protein
VMPTTSEKSGRIDTPADKSIRPSKGSRTNCRPLGRACPRRGRIGLARRGCLA